MQTTEEYLNNIGQKGSIKRLEAIASMNLGKRSEAAKAVCEKRARRKELMDMGLSYESAILITKQEYPESK
jgi:hypothetical protein